MISNLQSTLSSFNPVDQISPIYPPGIKPWQWEIHHLSIIFLLQPPFWLAISQLATLDYPRVVPSIKLTIMFPVSWMSRQVSYCGNGQRSNVLSNLKVGHCHHWHLTITGRDRESEKRSTIPPCWLCETTTIPSFASIQSKIRPWQPHTSCMEQQKFRLGSNELMNKTQVPWRRYLFEHMCEPPAPQFERNSNHTRRRACGRVNPSLKMQWSSLSCAQHVVSVDLVKTDPSWWSVGLC